MIDSESTHTYATPSPPRTGDDGFNVKMNVSAFIGMIDAIKNKKEQQKKIW